MTATVRYLSPLVWSSVPATTGVRQAAPVVWTQNFPSAGIRQAVPVVWSQQAVMAFVRNIQAVQWITSPTPLQFRKAQALQWTQDVTLMTFRKAQALQWTQDITAIKTRALQAVLWITAPSQGVVRQVNGYTLQQASSSGAVRQVNGYTLQLNRKPPVTGGLAGLWPLIVADASIPLVQAQLSVSAPFADSSQSGCNTGITVAPLGALLNQYSGHTNLYYNRASIADAFTISGSQWLLGTITQATTIHALLSSINSAYAIALDSTDINDGPVAAGVTQLTLTGATGSYVFRPGSTVILQNVVALTVAVPNVNLPGFVNVRGNLVDPSLQSVLPNVNLPGFANASGVGPTSNTVLLMHFNGTDGQTTTTDEVGHVPTMSGGAVLTATQAKFGTTSLKVIASGAICSVPDAPELQFPAGNDFTIEFWSFINAAGGDTVFLSKGGRTFLEYFTTFLQCALDGSQPGQNLINSVSGLSTAVWQHIAMCRQGTTWRFFINGALVATATSTGTWGVNSSAFSIGGVLGTSNINAYIDELRISKVARYTAAFTPPTAPFGVD
jgi:hypothetical protein